MEERDRIIEYINNTFNVNSMSSDLIMEIYDYLDNHNYSMVKVAFDNKIVKINAFILDFIDLLNNAYIDISLEEMLENKLLEIEE